MFSVNTLAHPMLENIINSVVRVVTVTTAISTLGIDTIRIDQLLDVIKANSKLIGASTRSSVPFLLFATKTTLILASVLKLF